MPCVWGQVYFRVCGGAPSQGYRRGSRRGSSEGVMMARAEPINKHCTKNSGHNTAISLTGPNILGCPAVLVPCVDLLAERSVAHSSSMGKRKRSDEEAIITLLTANLNSVEPDFLHTLEQRLQSILENLSNAREPLNLNDNPPRPQVQAVLRTSHPLSLQHETSGCHLLISWIIL
jgi:hypothetical protein